MTGPLSRLPGHPRAGATGEPAAELSRLLAALQLATLGTMPSGTAMVMPPAPQIPCDPHLVAAFGPGTAAVPVDIAPGVWAVSRAAGQHLVLCVANPGASSVTFDIPPHLAVRDAQQMVFLAGEIRTRAAPDGRVACELPPRGFVWLGSTAASGPAADGKEGAS